MPDRPGAIYVSYIHHRRIIIIARPDADDIITGIAHRPVIAEIGGGARLSRGRANRTRIALVALGLRVAVEIERATLPELEGTRGVIAEHIGNDKGDLLTDNTRPLWLEVENGTALRIQNRIDGMRWDAYPPIGKDPISGCFIQQVHAQRAQYHRIVWRTLIRIDAHDLRRM